MPSFNPIGQEVVSIGLYGHFYVVEGWLIGGNAPKFGYYGTVAFQLSFLLPPSDHVCRILAQKSQKWYNLALMVTSMEC